MFRVSIMYPNKEGVKFDFEYYRTKHMIFAEGLLKPFGLIKAEVDRGISGGGEQPPPYICVGYLYFESEDCYDRAVAEVGPKMRGDVPNFTNVTPIRQVSEIVY